MDREDKKIDTLCYVTVDAVSADGCYSGQEAYVVAMENAGISFQISQEMPWARMDPSLLRHRYIRWGPYKFRLSHSTILFTELKSTVLHVAVLYP